MKNSVVKIIAGLWLLLSGFAVSLQSPVNMIVVGAFLAVCCFLSHKTWQVLTTGILGLWLFVSGMIHVLGSAAVPLVSSVNFFTVGILLLLLGILSYLRETHDAGMKVHAA